MAASPRHCNDLPLRPDRAIYLDSVRYGPGPSMLKPIRRARAARAALVG
jgi:hypothetical protein